MAVAPFDAKQAKTHQEAWAKYLGVPVEFTNSIGMRFRLIPPGEFTMGMSKDEADAMAASFSGGDYWSLMALSSAPKYRVRLTQAYYLAVNEVTQEQHEKIVGTNPSNFSATGDSKNKVAGDQTEQLPVEMVSFIDAVEFCIKLSKQEKYEPVYFSNNDTVTRILGNGYRLPTEAEWEHGCRAGTTTSWFHGEQESALGTVAWLGINSGEMTHPVGQLKSNPFGLNDVHGNVWEWCEDWHDPQAYAQRGADITIDPHGPDAGKGRVLRGGDWNTFAKICHSAFRRASWKPDPYHSCGFRVCAGVAVARPRR